LSVSDPRFVESVRLFNEGRYFESHEELEKLWLETPKDDRVRDFYKGFIQCAAAIFLLKRGTRGGAFAVCRTATGYLDRYAPACLGLDVAGLARGMRDCFERAEASGEMPKAEEYPKAVLDL